MSKQIQVFLSSLKMAIATFCSRILGLVREQFIAYYFGASGFTDAFLVAYRIPNLLRDLFAEGAFSSAFVPTFVEAHLKKEGEARKLLWALFILLVATSLIIAALIIAFTPELVSLFAPSFKNNPEKFSVTITLTRIMSPFLCFISIAALFMGVLNSLKVFFLPSFAPAFFNVCMIVSMLIFPSFLAQRGVHPIISLAIGVLVGGLVQALVQFPLILKNRFGPIWPGKIFSQQTKKVLVLIGPGLLGFAASQVNLLVNTILASSTVVGAVSWLSFSFRLFQLPVGILSVSIGNSNLVHFGHAWKAGKKEEAIGCLKSSYMLSFFLVMPAMVALLICSEEIVSVIFERGEFDKNSTFMTAKALQAYAIGLPVYSLYKIFVPTFYAIDRQKIPVICSLLGIIFNIIFCVYLTPIYGFQVLALGTSLSMFLNTAVQGWILKYDLEMCWVDFINLRVFKILFSGFLAGTVAFYAKDQVQFFELSFLWRCLFLTSLLFVIALCYFFASYLLGEKLLIQNFLSRFSKKTSI